MSSGPLHYRIAEELLEIVNASEGPIEIKYLQVQAAQVHATLALAAAQVHGHDSSNRVFMPHQTASEWGEVLTDPPLDDDDPA